MLKCDNQILSITFLRKVNLFISFKYHLTEMLSGNIELQFIFICIIAYTVQVICYTAMYTLQANRTVSYFLAINFSICCKMHIFRQFELLNTIEVFSSSQV